MAPHPGRVSRARFRQDGDAPVTPSAIAAGTRTFDGTGCVDAPMPRALAEEEMPRIAADDGGLAAPAHPMVATVALGAKIDFLLNETRAKRYRSAAQRLAACADLARHIGDFAPIEPYGADVARPKAVHGRNTGFWSKVEKALA